MIGKLKFPIAGALCAVMLALCCTVMAAGAGVETTGQAVGGRDSVYVAGNPDWYPIEYYNPDTQCYEGILPQLLERIGAQTGLEFTYIRAGEEDQRLRLAKNGQVEMTSGCIRDEEEFQDYGMTGSRTILTVPQDGEEVQVCFAFTDVARDGLAEAVEGALSTVSDGEVAQLAVSCAMEQARAPYPGWLLPAALAGMALLLVVIVVLALHRNKYKRLADQDKLLDPITGIGNKAYFAQRFEQYISDQYRGIYCVVFIAFEIGKVNQYYGEAEAENQLRFAANELMNSTMDSDIAARVSGGGFVVVRPSSTEQEAARWTKELLQRLNRYGDRYEKDYHPDFTAGIYMLSQSDRDCETALFNAQQGYRRALRDNLPYAFSHVELLDRESEKLQLKKRAQQAIQDREFKMFLQFIVCGENEEITGAEALSRWEHPQKGLLHPGRYIELLESEKTVAELDFYMFEEACRQLERWQRMGRSISISCNFTRITIDQEDFIPRLQTIAGQYFFDYAALILEITEDVMEIDKASAFENISKCKALGFRIALDDMGSGYTSFSDLRDYPIDIVKIDRSILNSAVNSQGIALLKGIIALVHSLGIKALCEGVETARQCQLLRQLGCDYMQGFYFYRALPSEEADRLLEERGAIDTKNKK